MTSTFAYAEAARVARQRGLRLRRRSETHYQLTPRGEDRGWLLNLYPTNSRVWGDRNRPRGPMLNLPYGWTLMDAVNRAADIENRG